MKYLFVHFSFPMLVTLNYDPNKWNGILSLNNPDEANGHWELSVHNDVTDTSLVDTEGWRLVQLALGLFRMLSLFRTRIQVSIVALSNFHMVHSTNASQLTSVHIFSLRIADSSNVYWHCVLFKKENQEIKAIYWIKRRLIRENGKGNLFNGIVFVSRCDLRSEIEIKAFFFQHRMTSDVVP